MTIFCDASLSPAAERLLRSRAAPHTVLLARYPAASVLARADPDPAFTHADIVLGQPDLASVEASARLRWVQLTSAGYTRYDTPEFRALTQARGLVFTNSSGVYAEACAEHALAFLLAQARRLPQALASRAANGSSEYLELRAESVLLRHQRVLILGYGAIAQHLVHLLSPLQMTVAAYRRQSRGDEGIPVVSLAHLPGALAEADHVVSILPENSDSKDFMDEARFSAMKPGAVFYNIGRGATVDQTALEHALRSGHLRAAWLDVTSPEPLPEGHPLLSAPSCYITPHTAGGHGDESLTLVSHFLENLARFDAGSPLADRIL